MKCAFIDSSPEIQIHILEDNHLVKDLSRIGWEEFIITQDRIILCCVDINLSLLFILMILCFHGRYIAENVVYNLISTPENKKATGGMVMSKEHHGETTKRDKKMIYVTFFSYLCFIKSLSSCNDRVKIKALRRRAWGSASLGEEKWVS